MQKTEDTMSTFSIVNLLF